MKKILAGATLLLCVGLSTSYAQTAAAPAQTPAASTSKAVLTFTADTYDFGSIPQGTPVNHVFSFKNTGTEPLVITSVTASCGCTTPEWPKEPVRPGATASIKAIYNAAAMGPFTKTITVVSNANPNQKVLIIKGEVKTTPATAATKTAAPAQQAASKKN
jgi:hypothetical protein